MTSTVGRFAASDHEAAGLLLDAVIAATASWCNMSFEPIDDEQGDAESPLFEMLTASGPSNPLATIMAPTEGRRPRPLEIGIRHNAGTKAASQLRDAEILAPSGGRVVQDHPRRGLVIEWADEVDTGALSTWIVGALRFLGRTPTTEQISYEWTEAQRSVKGEPSVD